MFSKVLLLFTFGVLICKVQAQRCAPASTVITNPQILTSPPVVATTIVDNSVSNALANALQLLIVSDLLDSKLGPALASNLFNAPIVETLGPYGTVEVIAQPQYIAPCAPAVEVIQPCSPPMVETISPNIFGGYTESFSPLYPSVPIVERITPNACGGLTETISPMYRPYGPVIDKIQPNIFGGITETISPVYGPGPIIEKSNIFGGITEALTSLYGPQIIEQLLPGYSFTETISPNYCGGLTEVITQNGPYFNGVTEIVSPPCSLPVPSIVPNYYGGVSEVLPQYVPNYYGGLTEIVSGPPMAAEVLFPPSIPAQLTCNFGYSIPTNTPCVNFNVEPLPFEPCSNFGKTYFF